MRFLLSFFLATVALVCFSQDDAYLPKGGAYEIVRHTHYIIGYSEVHEQAAWVAYKLELNEIYGNVDRTDDFREDLQVSSGSASLEDYRGSGYDRGHLAPAADFSFDPIAMSESFYLSNMSPQEASFNRGVWASLEKQVRKWVAEKGELFIITGSVLNDTRQPIGPNRVSVPTHYFKILFSKGDNKAIAYLIPNEKGERFSYYSTTVDLIEEFTGLDFLTELPDDEEATIESSTSDDIYWSTSSSYNYDDEGYPSRSSSQSSTAIRCAGWAKSAGRQCKNMTTNSNKHCHVHQNQVAESKKQSSENLPVASSRCSATTKAGSRCKRTVASGSARCWQH